MQLTFRTESHRERMRACVSLKLRKRDFTNVMEHSHMVMVTGKTPIRTAS
jgi:hypothetical protein